MRLVLIGWGALALAGCSLLISLDDLTPTGSPAADGGNDGTTADASASDSGSTDAGGGDAALPPLNCVLHSDRITFTWDALCGADSSVCPQAHVNGNPRTMVYALPSGKYRLLLTSANALYYADFHDTDNTVALSRYDLTGSDVLSVVRYPAGAQSSGTSGTMALVGTIDPMGYVTVTTVRFDDSASAPAAGKTLLASTVLPGGNTYLSGTLEVIDPAGEHLVVLEHRESGAATVVGFHTSLTKVTSSVSVLATGIGTTGAHPYSIAHDATNAYVLYTPWSSGGPPTGPMPLFKLNVGDMSLVSTRQLLPDAGIYSPLAMIGSPTTAGAADIAFLEADLSSSSAVPVVRAGQVMLGALGSFDPSSITGPSVAISQLPINKSSQVWSAFASPVGDQLLLTSRPFNDGIGGLSFLWVDALGHLRSLVAETDGGAGWPATLIGAGDVMFVGAPAPALTSIRVTWFEGQGNSLTAPPVYSVSGSCTQ